MLPPSDFGMHKLVGADQPEHHMTAEALRRAAWDSPRRKLGRAFLLVSVTGVALVVAIMAMAALT